MLKNSKVKIFGSVIIAVMLFASFFFAQGVYAASAILEVRPNRNAIGPGESVSVSVQTTAQTNYVFAMVDGVRFQGVMHNTDDAGNQEWILTIFPQRSTNIVVFANTTNVEAGADMRNLPITVDFAAALVPAIPGSNPVVVPHGAVAQPFGMGPITIFSVMETTPTAAGMVQLTVVTGPSANHVWVQFDGTNRADGFRISTDATSSTWVINYRPRFFAPHTVTVFSNTTNNWAGAATWTHNVVLHQPFIPHVNPVIQSVTVTPRTVNMGGNVTIRIRTNADVGAVWVRDVNGVERGAWSISPTTATQRNWEVVFNPTRTGTVTIFANHFHTPWGAATRSEMITVRGGRATIVSTPIARRITDWQWGAQADTLITVTTNQWANSVWAVLPNRQTIPLRHVSGTGVSNRVWEAHTWGGALPITIHAAEAVGVIGGFSDATRTINAWTGGFVHPPQPWPTTPPWTPAPPSIPPPAGWPCWSTPWHPVPGTWSPCGICVYHGSGLWRNTRTNVLSHSPCGGWWGAVPPPSTGVNVGGPGWQYIQNGWHFNASANQSAWRGHGHGPPEWVNVHFNNRWYHMSRLGVMHPVSGGLPRVTTVVP